MKIKNGQRKVLNIGERGWMNELVIGQKARVLDFHHQNPAIRRRLLDMGITKGVEIELKKESPFGDPIDITLRGYELCLRKSDVEQIEIEVIK
jgi:ferrous iron transport protein A